MNVKDLIKHHEGVVNTIYKCPAGYITIGCGHNLEAKPISNAAVDQILDDDIDDCLRSVATLKFWFDLDEVRQAVLIDMCFNLGFKGLTKFEKMLAAIDERDYVKAAIEMMDSKWARQVGTRASRLEQMMITGNWPKSLK